MAFNATLGEGLALQGKPRDFTDIILRKDLAAGAAADKLAEQQAKKAAKAEEDDFKVNEFIQGFKNVGGLPGLTPEYLRIAGEARKGFDDLKRQNKSWNSPEGLTIKMKAKMELDRLKTIEDQLIEQARAYNKPENQGKLDYNEDVHTAVFVDATGESWKKLTGGTFDMPKQRLVTEKPQYNYFKVADDYTTFITPVVGKGYSRVNKDGLDVIQFDETSEYKKEDVDRGWNALRAEPATADKVKKMVATGMFDEASALASLEGQWRNQFKNTRKETATQVYDRDLEKKAKQYGNPKVIMKLNFSPAKGQEITEDTKSIWLNSMQNEAKKLSGVIDKLKLKKDKTEGEKELVRIFGPMNLTQIRESDIDTLRELAKSVTEKGLKVFNVGTFPSYENWIPIWEKIPADQKPKPQESADFIAINPIETAKADFTQRMKGPGGVDQDFIIDGIYREGTPGKYRYKARLHSDDNTQITVDLDKTNRPLILSTIGVYDQSFDDFYQDILDNGGLSAGAQMKKEDGGLVEPTKPVKKEIAKKFHDKRKNKTKIVYLDGSEDIVDGLQ